MVIIIFLEKNMRNMKEIVFCGKLWFFSILLLYGIFIFYSYPFFLS